jgi:cephalosporin-C deacetylase
MFKNTATLKYTDYKGSGIKPADHEEFWDKAFAELDECSLEYTLEQVDIPSDVAEFFHLYFTGVKGARVHCQYIRPKNPNGKAPLMLNFHGYHGDSGDFVDKVGLVAEGFSVLALDARGQGGLSEDVTHTAGGVLNGLIIRGLEEGPENLYYRSVFLDIAQMTRIGFALPNTDQKRVYCQGASQGGALALVCAALEPRVSKAFVQYPFLSDYRKAFDLDVATSAYGELAYWFQFRDPLHKKEAEFFDTLEYIDIQHLVDRIQANVIWGIGLMDGVCPPETQFAVYNKITSKKTMVTLPEYGHEYLPKFGDTISSYLFGDDESIFENK